MGRDIRFLAGVHRSGNTVLASILKQNPIFYLQGISPLVGLMWENNMFMTTEEISLGNGYMEQTSNFISKIPDTFYDYVEQPIIIDRCKSWVTPGNLDIIKKYINPKPKVLFTIRPLVEVVASLININKNYYVNSFPNNWNYKKYMSENDNVAELLLQTNGPLDIFLLSYNSLVSDLYKDLIHVIKYSDIVDNTESVMHGIYDFFDLDYFEHDFKNIKNKDNYNDSFMGFSSDLHQIRKSISKSKLKPEDILSSNMIDKINAMDPYYMLDF